MPQPTPDLRRLLRGVSRSFGLSIRLLPAALQKPVGLAYLLARLSDTIADTTTVNAAHRLDLLDRLLQALDAPTAAPDLVAALSAFASAVPHADERQLLGQMPALLEALQRLPQAEQAIVREVLTAITEGQRWDLQALDGPQHGVQTRAEIERYTWLVAGSVGEFWTRICALHLHHWHKGPMQTLMAWAAAYGQGLQRLNILRDAGKDLRAGRCYWPAEALQPLGLDSMALCEAARTRDLATLQRLTPLLDEWLHTTQAELQQGLRYSMALRGQRLRLASALPCLIGIHTLALLRQAGTRALVEHIKMPRRQVHGLLLRLLLSGVSDRQLQACWASARIGT